MKTDYDHSAYRLVPHHAPAAERAASAEPEAHGVDWAERIDLAREFLCSTAKMVGGCLMDIAEDFCRRQTAAAEIKWGLRDP